MAKLERELDFRRVAGIELGGQSLGLLVAASLAWLGGGVWAPVGGQIAWQIFVMIAAFVFTGVAPRLEFDRHQARRMLTFGIGITASQRTWQLRTLINPLLVARFAGAEAVAFVALAIRIAEALGTLRLAAGRMAIAALARLQGRRDDFRAALERTLHLQILTLGPLLCGFGLFGSLIFKHVIGVRWVPSLAVYPFVAAGVLVNSVYNLQASALFVAGRQWVVMRSYAAHVMLLGVGTLLFLPRFGIVGYGWAEVLACAAYLSIHFEVGRLLKISYRKLGPALAVFLTLLFIPVLKSLWMTGIAICAGCVALLSLKYFIASGDFEPATKPWLWINARRRSINTRIASALAALLLTSSFASTQTVVPAQYFGMHYVKSQPWPVIPFGSLRLWDTDTRWQQMNPERGAYDFSTLNAYLALAHSHSVSDVVLVLGGTPNWISSDPSNAICDYASVATGSCAPPADLNPDGTGTDQAWRSFIYQLAGHVEGLNSATYSHVAVYEMWNEFSRNSESWTGSPVQMLRMAQDAYCILKGSGTITATGESCSAQTFHVPAVGLAAHALLASPSAQASGPDLNAFASYLSLFLSVSAARATVAADVIATHNYTYGRRCCASAEALAIQWRALRNALPAEVARLPVWSTEGSWGDTATKEPNTDMQSAYVARAYLLGWSLGFKRMYWYAWGNSWGRLWSQSGVNGCSDQGSGTGCISPAAKAYASVYSWMVGNTMTRPCTSSGTVYSCPLTKPDGTRMLAMWDSSSSCLNGYCSRSVYSVPSGFGSYLDLANVRHYVRGHSMWISAKPVLLMSNTPARGSIAHRSFDLDHDTTHDAKTTASVSPSQPTKTDH